MTTERQEEAGPVTVQIGVCSDCHVLFLISGERQTSPCHGADPLAILATLTLGPNAQVTGEWGFGPTISADEMKEQLDLPVEEEAPAPAAEAPEAPPEPIKATELLSPTIHAFLEGWEDADADRLKGVFEDAGAEPEAASNAVGRLVAVRELLEQLSAAREAAPVAAAPSEAESSPGNS